MNIAYASDNNFVDVMCVSIMSFNDHNSDAVIYILDCGIDEHNKQKILELCSEKNTVLFIDAKKVLDGLDYDLNLDRGAIAAYARLFMGSMLPQEVTKVLYIDCDTLIRENLKELFDTNLQPYILGGVRDSFSTMNKKVFGIKKGGLFINSGVLLIDVGGWRKERIEDHILDLFSKKNKIFQGDQGVINAAFGGNVKELPLKFDVLTYLYDFTYEEMMLYRKPDNYFSKDEVKEATAEPSIVHFSSSFKSIRPWEEGQCKHPFYPEWNAYYTAINALRKAVKKKKRNASMAYLIFARILHAYIRPFIYMIK